MFMAIAWGWALSALEADAGNNGILRREKISLCPGHGRKRVLQMMLYSEEERGFAYEYKNRYREKSQDTGGHDRPVF